MTPSSPVRPFSQFVCTADGAEDLEAWRWLWTFDLWITVPLALSAALYGIGVVALWRRAGIGRGIRAWQASCYASGVLVLGTALVSPIHHWGSQLFSIHMVEHEIVIALGAPLIALGRPGTALAWVSPAALSGRLAAAIRLPGLQAIWRLMSAAGTAAILHAIAIWAWHVPSLFDAAIRNVGLHRLQHVSFLVTAVMFWCAMCRRRGAGRAAAHSFVTMLHTSILGALIALAPRVLYRLQTEGALSWGLTPLQDQQLAGLIMWIPSGTIYAGAILLFFAAWVRRVRLAQPAMRQTLSVPPGLAP
jgi:putative membrane protein